VQVLPKVIAGHSALMEANEEATVRDLKAHQALILPLIAKHGGHIIDTASRHPGPSPRSEFDLRHRNRSGNVPAPDCLC